MHSHNILSLDVGSKRVGVAYARHDVRVPVGLPTLNRLAVDFWEQLQRIIEEYEISQIIIGLPRNLEGEDTPQTTAVKDFVAELQQYIHVPVQWQDEALTSVMAEAHLRQSKGYQKSDVDMMAACSILTDYLETMELHTK